MTRRERRAADRPRKRVERNLRCRLNRRYPYGAPRAPLRERVASIVWWRGRVAMLAVALLHLLGAGGSFVQGLQSGSGSANVLSVSISPTAGNMLYLGVAAGANTQTISSIDTSGGPAITATLIDGPIDQGTNPRGWHYYVANIPSGITTMRVNFGSTTAVSFHCQELSGRDTSAPLKQHGTDNTQNTANVTIPSITTDGTYDLCAFGQSNAGITSNTATGIWTVSATGARAWSMHADAQAAGSPAVTCTLGTGGTLVVFIAAFAPASGAAAVTPRGRRMVSWR